MSEPAAFSASYSDFRIIKRRKVVQVVLELPIEAAGHAWNVLGGVPDPTESRWFGVARLKPGTKIAAHGNQGVRGSEPKPKAEEDVGV